jgi:hypothetical protein
MVSLSRRATRPLVGLIFLALAGCGHVPVTSMVRLARIDFETTDPERLRVAVKLPQALKARAEGTVLRITVRLASGAEESRDFSLREVDEREALAGEAEAGAEIATFAVATRDVAELRLFRAALIQKQKGGSGGALTIKVKPDACRTEPLPNGPVLFSTYLKTAETNGYVPLTRDVDLRRVDPNQDLAAKIPECRG